MISGVCFVIVLSISIICGSLGTDSFSVHGFITLVLLCFTVRLFESFYYDNDRVIKLFSLQEIEKEIKRRIEDD